MNTEPESVADVVHLMEDTYHALYPDGFPTPALEALVMDTRARTMSILTTGTPLQIEEVRDLWVIISDSLRVFGLLPSRDDLHPLVKNSNGMDLPN